MSEFNSILTDRELRDLLQRCMLEQDNALTEQMIEMESKIAFGTAPAIAAVMPNETEMIGKLTKSFAGKSSFLAWTIGLGISAALGLGIYTFAGKSSEKNTAPAIEKNTVPAEENITPDVAPGQDPFQSPANQNHLVAGIEKKEQQENNTGKSNEEISIANPNIPDLDPVPPFIPDPVQPDPEKKEATLTEDNKTKKSKSDKSSSISMDTVFTGVKMLVVDAGICDLSVSKGSGEQVKVKGGISVETKGLVTGKPEYRIKYERKGDQLRVWIEQDRSCTVIAGSINVNASLTIEVPAGTDTDLSANADISLNELDGRLCKVKSGYGNISANKINTGFSLTATSGNIDINHCAGGADVKSTYGDVSVSDHKGNMTIKSSSGEVTVSGLTGDHLEVKATYGNVRLSNIGAMVSLTSSSGDVQLNQVKGNVSVLSSYGNQQLNGISGNVMSTSAAGDVRIDELRGDLDIRSSYGNVHANNCIGNIVARSQSGDIKGKNIKVQDALELSATYGDIKIQLDNPLNDLSFDLITTSGDVSVKKEGANLKGDEGKLHLEKGKIRIKGTTTSGNQVYE